MSTVPDIATTRGRTQIGTRAVSQVVSAIAAEALGLRRRQVSVDLNDTAGVVDVTVRAPHRALPDAAADTDDDELARTEHTRKQVRGTVGELTGIQVGAVTVRLTTHRLHLPHRGS
ncbi:hypothetical protein K2F54_11210 [Cryobacterium sp. 1639]|uniref:hypothetical protein n=1 Tax=Cryobacterium inferilacus TaxID=2866629 RepID=UPI001C7311B3|nr:hypothetical protein [Cryobacterium sp. 1639]MBX0300545.1 hypothetical protein [Cryobacterium sp. 1639]